MTQEDLATQMEVSRQTISKWESSASFPEMEKILLLCGVIMLTATAFYLLAGFLWNLWHIGWVVYPAGGILCAIVSILLKKDAS